MGIPIPTTGAVVVDVDYSNTELLVVLGLVAVVATLLFMLSKKHK